MNDLRTFLHGLPAFERFGDRQLDALVAQLRVDSFVPGTVLIGQHAQGAALYIVMAGVVRVSRQDAPTGEVVEILDVHEGEIVGRLSLVADMPSPVTCVAADQVTVAALTLEKYNALFLLVPGVAHQFQYMVAAQLAHYLQQKNQALRQRLARRPPSSLLERLFGV